MGLTFPGWRQIEREIDRRLNDRIKVMLYQSVVTQSDPDRNVIYIHELGAQPIPMFTFDYSVSYIDTQPDGTEKVRQTVITPQVPKVGDLVIVYLQHGSRRLPKCLGVLRSTNFVLPQSIGN